MLFAADTRCYICRDCDFEKWKARPISPINLVTFGSFGLAVIIPYFEYKGWNFSGWWYIPWFVFFDVLGFGLIRLVNSVFYWLKRFPKECPSCGKELEISWSGISHSFLPSMVEVIAFIIFMAVVWVGQPFLLLLKAF